jgi:hypothetical protein
MNTPHPEQLAALAGTRKVLETAHKFIGATRGDEGTTREQRAPTADPDLIRRLQTGQACYIRHGGATFVQVARPQPSPLTLTPAPAPAPATTDTGADIQLPAPRREPAPAPGLAPYEDIFGPGAAR